MKALRKDAGAARWCDQAAVTGAAGLLDRVAVRALAAPVFLHSMRRYFNLAPGSPRSAMPAALAHQTRAPCPAG